jgi:hypothetical protein
VCVASVKDNMGAAWSRFLECCRCCRRETFEEDFVIVAPPGQADVWRYRNVFPNLDAAILQVLAYVRDHAPAVLRNKS